MNIETNIHRDSRIAKLKKLEEMGYNPYPYKFSPTHNAKDLQDKYESLEAGQETEDMVVVAGRAMAVRNSGMFVDLKDESGNIQVFCHKNNLDERNLAILANLDLGDIIGVEGTIRRTPRGELSVKATKFDIISKSLQPLPEKFHGLSDVETRYRQRYVDFIINDEAKEIFKKRCQITSQIRKFFEERGFLEVETPTLQPIMGGASARPFITHHNSLDMDLYLRVATELYLKRLIVGGFEKVFEIGKNFRNEGIDKSHNPEFTCIEAYQAYADYNDMMVMVEDLFRYVATNVLASTTFEYDGNLIDLSKPFRKASMIDLIKEYAGVDFLTTNTAEEAKAMAKSVGVDASECLAWGNVVAEVFDEKVEHHLIQPTFVCDMPKEVTPLAKTHRENDRLVEQFETYMCGMEITNCYSELSNPLEQLERFEDQVKAREAGDDEAQMLDEDFVNALENGFPPCGGFGMGIDRLAILLSGAQSIRDVIAFPTLRKK